MSYRCGTQGLRSLGIADDAPRIICDAPGCGRVYRIPTDRAPPSWFLNGKAPKGWRTQRIGEGRRDDRCPDHTASAEGEK